MGQIQTTYKKKIKSKKGPKFDSKEEYFIKNGGILLEKQIALSQGQHKGAGQLKIFSREDMEKATNNYDPALIIGSSYYGTVYKAILEDRIVAVKVPPLVDPNSKLVDPYLTEVSTLVVMNNDNMVKLYGCCLETFIPMLVYGYMSNGGLFQLLHGDVPSGMRIKWADCLRVATDAAYALSYMHNALSKPVVHRNVKSLSIVLDHSLHGKLSNFVYSVSITPRDTTQKWPVEGTPGYIDPEYIETQKVTDKCDVYSFGVLMLELLTRKQPSMMSRDGADLVDEFVSAVGNNCMTDIIDNDILDQASRDEIQRTVQLALTCVAKTGAERPSMIDIVGELWSIQGRNSKSSRNCA